jgi:hypothetical protein
MWSNPPGVESLASGTSSSVGARPSPVTLRLDYLPKFHGMRPSMSLCMC